MVVEIELSKKGKKNKGLYKTIVDDDDNDLNNINWIAKLNPSGMIYAIRRNGKSLEYIHRVILERKIGRCLDSDEFVDHIDRNSLNNTRDNLRIATKSQNNKNTKRRKDNTSGFKGVKYFKHRNTYLARIQINGKRIVLGYRKTAEEAFELYKEACKKYHKNYANFGEE